ncbi:peptidase M16 [Candidatus Thiodictyon syntrophicum]|uniref:Peptidase M16 n=1 Tax=Candidatus Thiodictyon syntrophicum TaxID=1166950 RepID=A0A2K8UBH5_9GAMM|nr:peptidase M16 [Candidatus Thiodictyon syntrophicum]
MYVETSRLNPVRWSAEQRGVCGSAGPRSGPYGRAQRAAVLVGVHLRSFAANLFPATLTAALLLLGTTAQATPKIETWQTANGARVLFVAAPQLPMVDVRVVFDAGAARDGERPGLAAFTAGMLNEGARDWNADTIAERMENVGASLSAATDRDMTSVAVRSLTREPALTTALETLAGVLAAPSFPADALERNRENALIGLRQEQEQPAKVAQKALYRQVFGAHPYASDPSGTEESVRALTAADLKAFHDRYYTGANAVVAIVGALDRPAAQALAEQVVGTLPAGERAPPLPAVPDLSAAALEQLAFPSSQTHVLAGQPGMARGDPDYFALYLGNHILGGSGLVSILMDEVREKRGLSYSTFSYFIPLAQPGPFLMGLQTKNEQAGQALGVLVDALKQFAAAGPTDAQLTAAKKNLTGGFPLRIAENAEIIPYLAVIGFYGLPLDYLDRFTDRINAISAEQIRDAFARRVHPERLAIVTVGGEQAPVAVPDPAAAPAAGGPG